MSGKDFSEQLRNGESPLIGTVISLPCPDIADALSRLAFDWLFFDLEHGNLNFQIVQQMVQATGERCASVVRVPSQDEAFIKKTLDIGVEGIMVPQINTADQAKRIVQLCKYPPEGTRGVGLARAQGYGTTLLEYLQTANRRISVIIQIEHIDAVNAVDEILAVDGIDAAFIGPFDLSGSIGKLGEVNHPDVIAAIKQVILACTNKGITAGIFSSTPQQAISWYEEGVRLFAVGIDAALLINNANSMLQSFREGQG
jgi:2-dehydro-3-deoxyglucarate aldolase/4-hydroxy-2-oxoheptanedioate aldolase